MNIALIVLGVVIVVGVVSYVVLSLADDVKPEHVYPVVGRVPVDDGEIVTLACGHQLHCVVHRCDEFRCEECANEVLRRGLA